MVTVQARQLDGAPFGAEVTGLDPGHLDDAALAALRDAHREGRGLVYIRLGRLLEADELHAITATFGPGELAPGMVTGVGRGSSDDGDDGSIDEQLARLRDRGVDPYLTHLGNVDPQSHEPTPVGQSFFGEWEWHTDMSYIDVPPTFSILHARQIPATGGDTWFASQVLAAAGLPDELRNRIEGRHIKHDSTYTSSGALRPGMTEPATPIEAIGATHPILRRVPETGQEALFLGRRTNAWIVGLPLAESDDLLDALWAEATRDAYCYRHRWQVGDVVIWDNRMLLHRRDPFPDDDIRFMWRTQTRGEVVVAV